MLKPACPPGKFRGTDGEVGPSRPPGIMWPGRLGLDRRGLGGRALHWPPASVLQTLGMCSWGRAGRSKVSGEHRLPGNLPAPREAPRTPGEPS